tara:strand:- start:3919 stop:4437 length:519 start_codon:yes stop_codon:yes gene_type:complete
LEKNVGICINRLHIDQVNWQEVCENPDLKDLQYRIELNGMGQIVMGPASNEHSFRQSRLIRHLLRLLDDGEVLPECSIDTSDGTKVADVVWFSKEFHARWGLATPYPEAPEICIEVLSPSNSEDEMRQKRALYFERGAKEVWICKEDNTVEFFASEGPVSASVLVPEFPNSI